VRDTATRTNVTLGHQVEKTTRASYQPVIDNFICPVLDGTPLDQLYRQGSRPFE
jgi:hypothetical protein